MIMKKHTALYIAQAAVIAAMYATFTILQNILLPGSASMTIQFRVAEVLTILAVYTHAAIPGLTIGCIAANISSLSALGPYDLIFGSAASFCAALTMYALRDVRFFKLPILAALMPALFNGLIVGFEISFFFNNNWSFNLPDFLFVGACVAIGELAVMLVLALPLAFAFEKSNLIKKLKL